MDTKQIGEAIRRARLAKGETQAVMGAKIGLMQQHISSYERGKRPAPKQYRRVLARSYGIKFDTGEVAATELSTPCRRITDKQPDKREYSLVEKRLIDQLRGVQDTLSEILVYGIRSRRGRAVLRLRS